MIIFICKLGDFMSLKTSLEAGFITKPQDANPSQIPTTISSSEETKGAVQIYEKTRATADIMTLMPLTDRRILVQEAKKIEAKKINDWMALQLTRGSISVQEAKKINDWMALEQKRFNIDDAIARMNNEPGTSMDHEITSRTL